MDTPTAAELRAHSALLTSLYAEDDDALDLLASITAPLVGSMTGREIGGSEGEGVPDGLLSLATQVIAMKTEQLANAVGTVKGRKRSLTRGNLSSFSAGSYSESYFGPDQAIRAKQLDADPLLAELLWALCTEAKKLEWLAIWDPANFSSGEGGLIAFEYGNRPNYTPPGWC